MCIMLFKDELDKIENLKWYPWVGENYLELPKEQRILILGESSRWGNTAENTKEKYDNPCYPDEQIKEAINNDVSYSKFLTGIHNSFKINNEAKGTFWNKVAYINFIQRVMDWSNGKDEKPNDNDKNDAWLVLFDLLPIIKPAYCVFFGNSAQSILKKNTEKHTVEHKGMSHPNSKINGVWPNVVDLTSKDGTKTKIILIKHPSHYNGGHFEPETWYKYLSNHISFMNVLSE